MTRFFYLICAGAIAITACTNNSNVKGMSGKDSPGADMKMSSSDNAAETKEERNKQIVMQSLESVSKHDAMGVLKDAVPEVIDYNDGSMPAFKGKDTTNVMISNWMKAFPDVKGENLNAVADGDWVVVWGDWSGTWKGDFMGQKANGKSYKIRDADIFRLNDDGKITEHHTLSTWPAIAAQTGMKMP